MGIRHGERIKCEEGSKKLERERERRREREGDRNSGRTGGQSWKKTLRKGG